jgi:type I protein arginine methyltransferase
VDFASVTDVLGYHRGMLADEPRTASFRRAIGEVVRAGDVVVDLGTGTGILAMFAARAGAERVYAIEQGPVGLLARELIAANGLADRVTVVPGISYDVSLPERADVLISETLWNFGLGEGMLGFVADARERFLKPGATIIPATVALHVAPATAEDLWTRVAWPEECYGIDYSTARSYALNNLYQAEASENAFLAPSEVFTEVELGTTDARDISGTAAFTCRAGTVHGLIGFFSSSLSPSIDLTNGPPKQTPSWAHTFMPLEQPLEIADGQRLEIRVETTANGSVWRWRTDAGDGNVFDQSTMWGFPLDFGSLKRRNNAAQPVVSRRGEAYAAALRAMDGQRPLSAIERDLAQAFPDVFTSPRQVTEFVRDIADEHA